MKKIICSILSVILSLSLAFSASAEIADIEIDVGETDGINQYDITEIEGQYKAQGRTYFQNSALMLNWSASAFEFNANCSGDISIEFYLPSPISNGVYFTVIIDGVTMSRDTCFLTSSGAVKIATGLKSGYHIIKLVRQSEAECGSVGIKSIGLCGKLEQATQNKKLYIEYIGSSTTCAYANLAVNGDEYKPISKYEDVTQGFAYNVSQELNADFSVVARQGIGAVVGYQKEAQMDTAYKYICHPSGNKTEYDFSRSPDIIFIGLGGNDMNAYKNETYNSYCSEKYGKIDTIEKVQQGFVDFLNEVRSYNPNSKIVWLHNITSSVVDSSVIKAVADAGGSEKGFYSLKLTANADGGNRHPSVAGHDKFTEEITDYVWGTLFDKSLGDVNNDADVNLKDAYETALFACGNESSLLKINADINDDRNVDLKDAALIMRQVIK